MFCPPIAWAQDSAGQRFDGPPPPISPEVISRDEEGRATVRATRITTPLILDGRIDEEVYTVVQSFGDFVQQEPSEGRPATERTEVWLLYDDTHVYVSARFWKSVPSDLLANEMRRDDQGIFRNDSIGIVLDTFMDRRSGYYFNTNALGGVRDALLIDENRNANLDFNAVWDVRSHIFDQGWSTEVAIPFRSLRYPGGASQMWGLLIQRIDWRKNEFAYLTPVPASYGGAGIWKVSSAATLVGIEAPAGGGRAEIKPYALSNVTGEPLGTALKHDFTGAFGVDVKYKVSRSINLDLTYNTDFAQAEADTQQANLSRFSLFYPEKRDFFLESQSVFSFGGAGARQSSDLIPILFFSRRIGLVEGNAIPITGGAKLTGRLGAYTIGALSIRTGDGPTASVPATTFSVARVRRDVFQRGAVGAMVTHRAPSATSGQASHVVGVDASLRPFQDLEIDAYYARSGAQGLVGDTDSYRGKVGYVGDRYGAVFDHLKVGDAFNPEVGFLSRNDFRRNYAELRFSPRLSRVPGTRKLSMEVGIQDLKSTEGVQQTREVVGTVRMLQESGDEISGSHTRTDDRPQRAFGAAGATIFPGSYDFSESRLRYVLGPQRPVVGTVSVMRGSFYGGERREISYNGRVALPLRFTVEPILTLNRLDRPEGRFTEGLVSARTSHTMSPRMLLSALVQFNSRTRAVGTNVRFRWEYRPGSDLYVVYSDQRGTIGVSDASWRTLERRSFVIKLTRLFQM